MNMRNVNMNAFTKANVMGAGSSYTENGAVSYNTTGSILIDQFGKVGTARGRDYEIVWSEQAALWAEDAESALRFPFYLRMITRKDNILGQGKTENVQKGLGARDESFKRLLWIAAYHSDEFYRNLWLLPVVGSWKDLWTIMFMASTGEMPASDFVLDTDKFFQVIAEGINDDNHRDLVKKYMPRIRSERKCNTPWAKSSNHLAKEFCKFAGWSSEEYRSFKSTGKAHEFQRVICGGLYSNIDWKTIPGKALLNLVSGKFLANHNLTRSYVNWLEKQPVVKFNGYAFDLLNKIKRDSKLATEVTVNKQFDSLIKTAKDGSEGITGNVLCALDTSGSMQAPIKGGPAGLTSYDVCVSLGIYFSELNTGAFHNTVAMFDDDSTLMQISGTFTEKAKQIRDASTAWGGTDFQSLIDLICKTRTNHPEIPESEFPKTLLVVSDMQFNGANSYRWDVTTMEQIEASNVEAAKRKLRGLFSKDFVDEFKFVWWYCAGRETNDMPSTLDDHNSYFFSGFDPAVVTFLLGGEVKTDENGETVQPTMEEIAETALSQEVLMLVH